jgi:hypothetical protein
MNAAVNEAVGELHDLAGKVASLEGESAPIAANMRNLAQRLSNAYTPPPAPPEEPPPAR